MTANPTREQQLAALEAVIGPVYASDPPQTPDGLLDDLTHAGYMVVPIAAEPPGTQTPDVTLLRRSIDRLRSPMLCNWDPAVAHALADWLDAHAKDLERSGQPSACDSPGDLHHALTVAGAFMTDLDRFDSGGYLPPAVETIKNRSDRARPVDEVVAEHDAETVANQVLPLDGPYTPDRVHAAAALVAELVRRLNHATLGRAQDRSLPTPQDIDRVVSTLHAAAAGLPQLCRQLSERIRRYPLDRLGVDDHGDGVEAVVASTYVSRRLLEAADTFGVARSALGDAQSVTSRLYVKETS